MLPRCCQLCSEVGCCSQAQTLPQASPGAQATAPGAPDAHSRAQMLQPGLTRLVCCAAGMGLYQGHLTLRSWCVAACARLQSALQG